MSSCTVWNVFISTFSAAELTHLKRKAHINVTVSSYSHPAVGKDSDIATAYGITQSILTTCTSHFPGQLILWYKGGTEVNLAALI